MSATLCSKFKIVLCTLVLGCTLSAPVIANEINYTDAEQAPLQTTPAWFTPVYANALFPGTTDDPLASGNIVTVNFTAGGSITSPAYIFGGLNNTGDASHNQVNFINGAVTSAVYGAYVGPDAIGNATYNTVTVTGGSIGSSVFGGFVSGIVNAQYGATGDVAHNTVTITNAAIGVNVYGGSSGSYTTSNVYNNNVYISNSTVGNGTTLGYVYGGASSTYAKGDITHNTVYIVDSFVTISVMGAYLQANASGNAENNTITIEGDSTVKSSVYGAYMNTNVIGDASNNTINIGGNTAVTNNVFGAYFVGSAIGNASNNTINISGGSVGGSVYGAYLAGFTGEAQNNTVRISGTPNLSTARLYGSNNNSSWATDGNTLIVDDYRGSSVNTAAYFQNYKFIIGDNVTDTNAALKVDNAVNLNGTTVGITGLTTSLSDNVELMLIDNTTGTHLNTYDGPVSFGFGIYQFEYYYSGTALMARLRGASANMQTKALSEGFLAGAVFLNHKNELMSGWGLPAMGQALKNHPNSKIVPFTATQGGGSTYKTGSSLNVKGFSSIAGLAFSINSNLSMGAFFEGGWGNYNSRNSFNNAPSVKGNGGASYYGGGVMARQNNIWQGLYAQGYFSMGRSEVDFKTNDMVNTAGQRAEFDSSSTYYSAHVGLGYLLDLTENVEADVFARYLWNRMGQDSVTVGSDPVKFKAVDSHRAQLGTRVHYNLMPGFTPYAGALWEYEFGGKAEARISGMNIDAPTVRGATVMGELGFTLRPDLDAPLYIEAGVQGYVGKREGVSGTVRLSLTF